MWEEGRRLVDFFKKKPNGEAQNGVKIEEDPRPKYAIGGWLEKSKEVERLYDRFQALIGDSKKMPDDLVEEASEIEKLVGSGLGEEDEVIERLENFLNAVEFRKAV